MEKIIEELLSFNAQKAYEDSWKPSGWKQAKWFLKPQTQDKDRVFSWNDVLTYNPEKLSFVRRSLKGIDKTQLLKNIIDRIMVNTSTDMERFKCIITFVQKNIIHPMVEQPMESDAAKTFRYECSPETVQAEPYQEDLGAKWVKLAYEETKRYGSYLGVWCNPLAQKFTGDWGLKGMATDALELLLLHEARCGAQACVVVQLAQLAGFRARLVQVRSHRVAEVFVDGTWVLADPDVWAEGFIPLTDSGFPVTIDWCRTHPDIVDSWPTRVNMPPSYSWYFAPEVIESKFKYLQIGKCRPVFDHLDKYTEQLDAVIASRCTVNFAGGDLGRQCYEGLKSKNELAAVLEHLRQYNRRGHENGVSVMLSYLCATSIVCLDGIESFKKHWDAHFPDRPADFDPAKMLQQDINGKDLPSWYGGNYLPADTWNPYWRQYHKYMIKLVIESGHDGVFYDNPTVHALGNYSFWAMQAWKQFLVDNRTVVDKTDIQSLRELTVIYPEHWKRFRTTAAPDFLREIRDYARTIKQDFILTCNNSLNTWDSFYSQPRYFGYSIYELSKSEDLVVIEDVSSQPRREGDSFISYAGTIKMIHSVGRDLPLVVCTIAHGNYWTPPHQRNLAIAECTAHNAAYMVWSCWDEQYRGAMSNEVEKYHNFIDKNTDLLASTKSVSNVLLIFAYNNWLKTDKCHTAELAFELSSRNIQYDVAVEGLVTAEKLKKYAAVVFHTAEEEFKKSTRQLLDQYLSKGGKIFSLRPVVETIVKGVTVSSACPGYLSKVIFDGAHFSLEEYEKEKFAIAAHRNLGDPDNTFMTENFARENEGLDKPYAPVAHYIVREWSEPQLIERVVVWWSAKEMWPEKYFIQICDEGGNWTNVMPGKNGKPVSAANPGEWLWHKAQSQREEFTFNPPIKTSKISILQEKFGGGEKCPGMLAIQGMEIYPPNSQENIAKIPGPQKSADFEEFTNYCEGLSLKIEGQPSVRGVVRKTKDAYLLHLYNLDVVRQDNYHDTVNPVGPVSVKWLLPETANLASHLKCLTPDQTPNEFEIPCCSKKKGRCIETTFTLEHLHLWTIITA